MTAQWCELELGCSDADSQSTPSGGLISSCVLIDPKQTEISFPLSLILTFTLMPQIRSHVVYVYVWRLEGSLNFTELIKQEEAWQFHGCPIPIRKGRKKQRQWMRGKEKAMRSWDKPSTETETDEWAEGGTLYILSVKCWPGLTSVSCTAMQ